MSAGAFNPDKMGKLVDEGQDEKFLRQRDNVIKLKAEGKL